ncbi:MAG TPA: pitrilysin family protein [Chitinophagales bacterium]|nr:pitrilysin family protein [Chitinophagales bacterium]HRK27185.1 pitrilysin family protein [Chitinophagales bacterium]
MTTLDRSLAPSLQPVTQLHLQPPQAVKLNNGLQTYLFNTETQDIILIKLIFNAGKWQEPQPLVAKFTNSLIEEGTAHFTSRQLAEKIEFYGANLITRTGANHAEVNLSCLTRHLPHLLPILQELVTQATFPEQELQTEKQKARQRLAVAQQKNDYLAEQRFKALLYGSSHPYGYPTTPDAINAIQTSMLHAFYHTHYTPANCTAYIGGKFTNQHLQLINRYLGATTWNSPPPPQHTIAPAPPYQPAKEYISKPGSLQAALFIGKPMFSKNHPHYMPLLFVNTLLGGFFGSRLMRNIREDKGYTYGIYSALVSMLQSGYFYIAAEVGQNVWQAAVEEIYKEIHRLQTQPVAPNELLTAKNYTLGKLLGQIDGTINTLATVQGLYMYGLTETHYTQLVQMVQNMTSEEVNHYAQLYLNPNSLTQVVAGA